MDIKEQYSILVSQLDSLPDLKDYLFSFLDRIKKDSQVLLLREYPLMFDNINQDIEVLNILFSSRCKGLKFYYYPERYLLVVSWDQLIN